MSVFEKPVALFVSLFHLGNEAKADFCPERLKQEIGASKVNAARTDYASALLHLAENLFDYMVAFRRRISTGSPMDLDAVDADLQRILERMQQRAMTDERLEELYEMVRYPLVAFADEVILNSGWVHAAEWERRLLEQKYFRSNVAGNRFFELIDGLDDAPSEVVRIYYYCLALGYCGQYVRTDPELIAVKRRLLSRLQADTKDEAMCPDAYQQVKHEFPKLRHLWKWHWSFLFVFMAFAFVFLIDRFVIWNSLTFPVSNALDRLEDTFEREQTVTTTFRMAPTPEPVLPEASKAAVDKAESQNIIDKSKTTPIPSFGAGYVLQMGAYQTYAEAKTAMDNAVDYGFAPMVYHQTGDDKEWYLLITGPYASQVEAEAVRADIQLNLKTDAVVRPQNQLVGECVKGCDNK